MSHQPIYSKISDEELMAHISSKSINAFNELYGRYSSRMTYYFYRMLGHDKEKAQDFLQDLFMKVVERPEMFDRSRRFSTWLFSCAHNMCKNEYRKMEVRKVMDSETEVEYASGTVNQVDVDLKDFTRKVYEELDEMEEGHRTAFILRHREGFSIKEISMVIDCPEGTVKSKLFYTTKKLSIKLQAYNPKLDFVTQNEARH